MENKKYIIFDWGRTIYDPETKQLFPETINTLSYLKAKYDMAIVALATKGEHIIEERMNFIKENNLDKYFTEILMDIENKDSLYEAFINKFNIVPEKLIIVDDRVVRGIKWGNNFGCTTVWVKNGKFSEELPYNETGQPTYTIKNIGELVGIL